MIKIIFQNIYQISNEYFLYFVLMLLIYNSIFVIPKKKNALCQNSKSPTESVQLVSQSPGELHQGFWKCSYSVFHVDDLNRIFHRRKVYSPRGAYISNKVYSF